MTRGSEARRQHTGQGCMQCINRRAQRIPLSLQSRCNVLCVLTILVELFQSRSRLVMGRPQLCKVLVYLVEYLLRAAGLWAYRIR